VPDERPHPGFIKRQDARAVGYPNRREGVRQRLILATTASCALVMLVAIHNGAFDAGAAVVLVGALLLFVRAAFRLVDDVERDEERAARAGPKHRPHG
jgi:hypothetical protein